MPSWRRSTTRHIDILYANHWPEVVPLLAEWVRPGDALVTEDAPSPEFVQMLAGDLPIDDYLMLTDIEFPEFGRRMCRLWQRLHQAGVTVIQVEPFIEKLLEIHTLFATGGTPDQIEKDSIRGQVYQAEREAIGALIEFYQASLAADFDTVVDATLRFARCDARRFVLRDRMRAEAIARLLATHPRLCVEAGQIHLALVRFLRRRVPETVAVKPVFLMRTIVRRLGGRGHLYPPGDLLTLLYVFNREALDRPRHRLLAARALIYAKVAAKDEIVQDAGLYPRTLDDLRTIALVNRLSYRDCHEMFAKIRRQAGAGARQALAVYLRRP
ncbi:hypothetical protein [Desulfoglaeba alkanexedens]|uniref:Uncharacterized protein n=1 Tax=Desulfoglaeba alkanexedens ALDC TaxID=980445 RepID=A0A4V1ERP7_9BACT|nr:hypothetical protein [Desulfoglaeba alkanexedens]QCQ22381.1 hypothetical protein FDQ92_09545 [Desulfoglaeba alkanexedens ALDC]